MAEERKSAPSMLFAAQTESDVEECIARGEDPNELSSLSTPLISAIWGNKEKVFHALLRHGANPRGVPEPNSYKPLHEAASQGHPDMVEALVRAGADIDEENIMTPLVTAITSGHFNVLDRLLQLGADPDLKNLHKPAIMWAVLSDRADMVERLAAEGANINFASITNETPLMLATKNGYHEVVKKLLELGATIEIEEWLHPLLLACKHGYVRVVEAFLDHGIDINLVSGSFTPLIAASKKGNTDVVDFLIQRGAKIDLRSETNMTALMVACMKGKIDVMDRLLQHGSDVNFRDDSDGFGFSPIFAACISNNLDVFDRLIAFGADFNALTVAGQTALMGASQIGSEMITDRIISLGVDVNVASSRGKTALMYAAKSGHVGVIKLLLKANANVDLENQKDRKAIDMANTDEIKLLLQSLSFSFFHKNTIMILTLISLADHASSTK